MPLDKHKIIDALKAAVENNDELSEKQRDDVVFHMTDWLDDLDELYKIYSAPEKFSAEEIYRFLMAFLSHVPEHVAEASRLMTGFPIDYIFQDDSSED